MYTEYGNLPGHSRIWIYQSDRFFNERDTDIIDERIVPFLNQWERHGEPLKASYKIVYNLFLVVAVDEAEVSVSGCSIDASVRFIKELEQELGLDLTNKLNIAYRSGDDLLRLTMADFQLAIEKGEVNEKTIVFNNVIATKRDLETKWEVSARESWHKRLF